MTLTAVRYSVKLTELEALTLRGFGKNYTGIGTVFNQGREVLDFEWTYCKRNGVNILNMPTALLQPEVAEDIRYQIREAVKEKYRGAV